MTQRPIPETDFHVLCVRYAPKLARLARRLGASDPEAIVQDTLLSAWRSLPNLRETEKVGPWIAKIAARKSNAETRRLNREHVADQILAWDPARPRAVPARSGVEQEVRRAVSELPKDVATALLLARLEGQDLAEVAKRLGVSLATAKRRIAEGEASLRSRFS